MRMVTKIVLLSPIFLALFMIMWSSINGAGCDYQLNGKNEQINYSLTCKLGKVQIIETNMKTGSIWLVSARQFVWMNQVLFLIHQRVLLSHGNRNDDDLSNYNAAQSGYAFVYYAWMRISPGSLILFQVSPNHDVILLNADGSISLVEQCEGIYKKFSK